MKKRPKGPLPVQVLRKIASRIGARIHIEPEWKTVGQITFKNGKRSYFWNVSFDINPLGSSVLADDKDYASYFMGKLGYPVASGKAFYSSSWSKAIGSVDRGVKEAVAYAESIGWPVIVKPNSQCQGRGVSLVYDREALRLALRDIFKDDKIGLVQKPLKGKDYRIVVLDKKVISAYERIPLSIVGDGRSSVRSLLRHKQKYFESVGRDTKLDMSDTRIKAKLARQKLHLGSILPLGRKVYLLDNANLSSGGDAIDVTKDIHKDFKKMSVRLTKDMGLRLCGVDIMVDGDIREKPKKYWILEINETPGLDHYAKIGKEQERIVEDLYLEVLKSLER